MAKSRLTKTEQNDLHAARTTLTPEHKAWLAAYDKEFSTLLLRPVDS